MSAMRVRAALRRSRRRLLVVLAVVALAGAVAAHHGAPMDMHSVPEAAMCVAVAAIAGAALAVGAAVAFALPLWAPLVSFGPRPEWRSVQCRPAARAGPLFVRLQVLRT